MPKTELKAYFDWFVSQIPERLSVLESSVNETKGFEDWSANYSISSLSSLKKLGKWFETKANTRTRTKQEMEKIRGNFNFPTEISDQELTNETFSIAIDIGMYFAEVLRKKHKNLQWNFITKGRKDWIDYGQPILIGFDIIGLNPVHIMVTLAYGFVKKSKSGERLSELFSIWSGKAKKRAKGPN